MSDHTPDHSWFRTLYPSLQDAYCLTLVEGVPPGELLGRAGAESGPRLTGVDAVCEAAEDLEAETDGERMLIAAADPAGWTLVVEPNGYLGVREESIAAWADTTLVAHFRNVNAITRFCWYADGTTRLHAEDMAPRPHRRSRTGLRPGPVPRQDGAGPGPRRTPHRSPPDRRRPSLGTACPRARHAEGIRFPCRAGAPESGPKEPRPSASPPTMPATPRQERSASSAMTPTNPQRQSRDPEIHAHATPRGSRPAPTPPPLRPTPPQPAGPAAPPTTPEPRP
ncbi:DUF6461 domain-containing protein [Kitasatospora sp. NPDC101235]|uniref:DUF6461 domain-containing protein n=1 Tax=Kitasatospora sp. NPDC101235 TaxID=3364101 RepID=UPI003818100C